MGQVVLNGEVTLTYPEGFRELTREEIQQMEGVKGDPGMCIRDEERHIIVTAGWKKSALAALMLKEGDVTARIQGQMESAMEEFGYELQGFLEREVGGKTVKAFRYTYETHGVGMLGEALVVKHKRTFYYLYFYCRTEQPEPAGEIWEEMMRSIKW